MEFRVSEKQVVLYPLGFKEDKDRDRSQFLS
jgi:hypothetical protein